MKSFFRSYWAELALAVLVFCAFAIALNYPFLEHWDDSYYVLKNEHLAFTWENVRLYWKEGMLKLWTPLTMMSLMLDNLFWGHTEAFGYHLTNILLHCGCAVLFVRILRQFGIRTGLAFALALIWAVHPQRLESVVWIAERKDVLSGILALGSLYAFMRSLDKNRIPWLAGILYLLAVTAKPSPAGLIFIFLILWWRKHPEYRNWKTVSAVAAVLLAGTAAAVVFLLPELRIPSYSNSAKIVLHNLVFYFADTLVPYDLNPVYPLVDFKDVWIFGVFTFFFMAIIYFARKAEIPGRTVLFSFLGFGAAFVILFLPASGAVQINPVDYADRYSYLPSLAVWAFSGFLLEEMLRKYPVWQNPASVILAVLGIFAAYQTWYYMPVWKSDESLLQYAIRHADLPNDRAATGYAQFGYRKKNTEILRESAEALICKFNLPDYPRNTEKMAYSRRMTALMLLISAEALDGNIQQALVLFREFVREKPKITFYSDFILVRFFKDMMLQFLNAFGTKEDAESFIFWAAEECRVDEYHGKQPVDYTIAGAAAFLKKNYAEAEKIWAEGVRAFPQDRNLQMRLQKIRVILDREKGEKNGNGK